MNEPHPARPALPQQNFCIQATPHSSESREALAQLERIAVLVNTVIVPDPDGTQSIEGGWLLRDCVVVCHVIFRSQEIFAWELMKRFWIPTPGWLDLDEVAAGLTPDKPETEQPEAPPAATPVVPETVGQLIQLLAGIGPDKKLRFTTNSEGDLSWYGHELDEDTLVLSFDT